MGKSIFKPFEVVSLQSKVLIRSESHKAEPEAEELVEALPLQDYSGPTADDLRREAELFRASWEKEKDSMIETARDEAARIVSEAEKAAFEEVQRQTSEIQKQKREAQEHTDALIASSKKEVERLEAESTAKIAEMEAEAKRIGLVRGKEEGFQSGAAEVERLVGRLRLILDRATEKRSAILEEAESQIIELVLLMTRKVVKVISENQKSVVIQNIAQALRKLKSRKDVIIRVNMADLAITTAHIKDFINLVEQAKSIQVVEDSTVGPGGCVIETDFGEIDARISHQLKVLEDSILEVTPILAKDRQVDKDERTDQIP